MKITINAIKASLIILISFSFLIQINNTYSNNPNKDGINNDTNQNNINNKNSKNNFKKPSINNIITEKQEIIDTYKVRDKRFNVFSIPKWKYDIMKEIGLNDSQKIHYHSINTIECGKEFGDCVNDYDIGPFQINNMHKEEYDYSKSLIDTGDFEKLYKFQLKRAYDRLERYKRTICKDREEDKKLNNLQLEEITFGCMLKVHNGNNKERLKESNFKIKDLFKIKGLMNREILFRKLNERSK